MNYNIIMFRKINLNTAQIILFAIFKKWIFIFLSYCINSGPVMAGHGNGCYRPQGHLVGGIFENNAHGSGHQEYVDYASDTVSNNGN